MRKIGIVTDSHSGISQKLANELEIDVIPMPFYFGDTCYFEDVSISRADFFARLKNGEDVSTSQPSPQDTAIWFFSFLLFWHDLMFLTGKSVYFQQFRYFFPFILLGLIHFIPILSCICLHHCSLSVRSQNTVTLVLPP